MHFSNFLVFCAAVHLASGFLVNPPVGSTAAPDTTEECSGWIVVTAGETCTSVIAEFGITLALFESMNPISVVGGSCSLLTGFAFCMQEDFGESSTTSTSVASTSITSTTLSTVITTTAVIATTTTCNGISTPTPVQPGIVSSCDEFHLVVSGDTCAAISTQFGISLTQFETWNPAVGISCEFLGLGDFVCVNIIGFTITTSPAPTTTIGNGITTPTPFQTGMVTDCQTFHLVVSGDTCALLASEAGVSVANIEAWNPAVGTSCELLGLGDFVCIGLIGRTATTTTSTTTGDGITTPTPFQTGMVTNCNTFHLVLNGDTCAIIAAEAGVSVTTFEAWNPTVGPTCEFLDLGDFVCIGLIGGTPTTTTTTTTVGDGVTTPTPFQPGMVPNCKTFHLVVEGDQCGTVAATAGISLAQFISWNPAVGSSCSFLDLGDFVCIAIL